MPVIKKVDPALKQAIERYWAALDNQYDTIKAIKAKISDILAKPEMEAGLLGSNSTAFVKENKAYCKLIRQVIEGIDVDANEFQNSPEFKRSIKVKLRTLETISGYCDELSGMIRKTMREPGIQSNAEIFRNFQGGLRQLDDLQMLVTSYKQQLETIANQKVADKERSVVTKASTRSL